MATVLIVEDDNLLADCLARWVAASGHEALLAADAQSAIDCLEDTVPDAIVLDILLPGANGIQVLHTLRSHTDLVRVPVIICSNSLTTFMPSLRAYGVRSVIDKTTLTRGMLAAEITKAIHNGRTV